MQKSNIKKWDFGTGVLKQFDTTWWINRLFQIDWGKTASAARILSPNLTRRPLPYLLIQSFFYGWGGGEENVCTGKYSYTGFSAKNLLTIFLVYILYSMYSLHCYFCSSLCTFPIKEASVHDKMIKHSYKLYNYLLGHSMYEYVHTVHTVQYTSTSTAVA